jgi:hypothetical protein
VRHQYTFLDHQIADLVTPIRDVIHQPKLLQVRAAHRVADLTRFRTAELQQLSSGLLHVFGKVIQHDRAPERAGQRGDEKTVIFPRHGSRNGARRIPPESVRDEPLPLQLLRQVAGIGGGEVNRPH